MLSTLLSSEDTWEPLIMIVRGSDKEPRRAGLSNRIGLATLNRKLTVAEPNRGLIFLTHLQDGRQAVQS